MKFRKFRGCRSGGKSRCANCLTIQARDIVSQSDGLEQTRALAQEYADKAVASISMFPAGEAKEGLEEMCLKVMKRRK